MPVFSRPADGYVRLILDGDFTIGELERVGVSELASLGGAEHPALMLDCAGAAGLERKKPADLERMAAFLAAFLGSEAKMAILAPGKTARLALQVMVERAEELDMSTRIFPTRAEAEGWLAE